MTLMLEQNESPSAAPPTLHYATPARAQRRGGVAGWVALIAAFVCVASISIFALVVHEHLDVWAAATAAAALAAMGIFSTFFLTRGG